MKQLLALEQALQTYVLEGRSDSAFIQALPGGRVDARVQVYRSAYYLRLIEILAADYPKLSEHLGNRAFGLLVRDYLGAYPSCHYSVREVGVHLSLFLKEAAAYPGYLVSLAEFEWALSQVNTMWDDEGLTVEALSDIDSAHWADVLFQPVRAHSIVHAPYDILSFWETGDITVCNERDGRDYQLVVWRNAHDKALYFQYFLGFEGALLTAFAECFSFERVCEIMASVYGAEDSLTRIVAFIQDWIQRGLLIFRLPR